MAKVVVLSTGGTIASRHDPEHGDIRAVAGGAELVADLHGLPDGLDIEVVQLFNHGSYALGLDDAFRLARAADEALRAPDVSGMVVTHGTDTMEESAFMAELTVRSDKPVVFTGAQRLAEEPDRDGPRNLAAAIRLAADPRLRGFGTMIAFDEEFHAARDVTKTHTSRVGTFQSAEHGKLGDVDGDRILIYRTPRARAPFDVERVEPAIELVRLAMGCGPGFFHAARDAGARGIVVEAFGRGNVTPGALEGIRACVADGLPVLITSRCPQGRVEPIYGNGGGKDVAQAGAIFAGDLSGIKARILLSVLVGAGAAMDEIVAAVGRVAD
ncbi:asparaginase [Ancylobacter mangrovi]|uniref:asparaginase n=1 Tax=Ancylobacter mangrovi TaxID=2972472 RepID=UPI002163AD30|nr:asparaginase [Ancylobacter mangrovi]MCS0503272.1 asparaginase [Ancylobacter mangrovi]